ncbi:ATP-dependent metallopeptidase FtsH/Yme1/Tma family protein [Deinococcus multiflagellatus]|uniref:ATP-dependent metallopeptidase FtsH/Yme1/Tma family protein n=1 Tax=Deinococcus multiflagellatus TaxID=1656887 RepID=A0ABW1ZLN7_9DEIO|nr:ATP-dependent metallopeptidase FtsH/Yme1/Tma family protein [Deinococcus multiflagellatus]MBZ9713465.1 ATP-dependent metallopeptidase FtsH/Yme1/Tma family protein [Deinococcus multiflagellatus]
MTKPRVPAPFWPVLGGVLALCVFAALGLLGWRALAGLQSTPLSDADFRSSLSAGQVQAVVVRGKAAQVSLRTDDRPYRLAWPEPLTSDRALLSELKRQNVTLRFEQPNQWLGILLNFLPIILLALFMALPLVLLGALFVWLRERRVTQR